MFSRCMGSIVIRAKKYSEKSKMACHDRIVRPISPRMKPVTSSMERKPTRTDWKCSGEENKEPPLGTASLNFRKEINIFCETREAKSTLWRGYAH